MGWEERVWGYTGAGGMVQALAAGYFLWDLGICVRYFGVFGVGLLAHAVAALVVFSFGFVSVPSPLTISLEFWVVLVRGALLEGEEKGGMDGWEKQWAGR